MRINIISMLGVMTLHILGHGGILDSLNILSVNYNIVWLLETCAYCAVDCFMLISGYIGVESKFKYSNLIYLWLETEVYSVGIMLLFMVVGIKNMRECITAFFSVIMSQYWFFSMYIGMMLLAPVINIFIRKSAISVVLPIVISTTGAYTVLSIANENIFGLGSGYSVLWFLILYMWGGTIYKVQKEYQFNVKIVKQIVLVLLLFSWLSKIFFETMTIKLYGEAKWGLTFIKYTSPTILGVAIGLLIMFIFIYLGS